MNGLENKNDYNVGLDLERYKRKDITYCFYFDALEDGLEEGFELEPGEVCCKLGKSSNIELRDNNHNCNKDFPNIKYIRCFEYKNGNDMSAGEKRFKDIVRDMGLSIKYFNYKECFVATKEQLEIIFKHMEEHQNYLENKIVPYESEINLNIEKEKTKQKESEAKIKESEARIKESEKDIEVEG